MAPSLDPILFLVAVLVHCLLPVNGGGRALESVPDLEKAMYLKIDGYPCVRLLNISSEIGCSNPGREKVAAPIMRYKNDDEPVHPSAFLVSADQMQHFFLRVSSDKKFATKVAGVLVEPGAAYDIKSSGFSPDRKFPSAEFANYENHTYEWNPAGSSIMWNLYHFPVFLISPNTTVTIQEIAVKNERSKSTYKTGVAEFDLVMQTTKMETHDSESCLQAQTCLPLGGYSVWSSLPPIDVTSAKQRKPLIVAMSSMDSASFFRDQALGADSPQSGMIAMLAAVDALSHVEGLDELKKQLIFMVFTGESWGYIGSQRFFAELDMGTDGVNGLEKTLIDQVLEVGSVGKGLIGDSKSFFAHSEGDSSSVKEILTAMEQAAVSLPSKHIELKLANSTNPGVPPSSMMTFLRKNSSIAGVVLEDFDTAFTNNFYHSHLDDSSNINPSSIAAAATLVARTLYILARDNSGQNLAMLNSINVNTSLVDELIGCLLTCKPGMSCDLVKDYITPSSTCPNHYVGVFLDSPSNTQYPEHVGDTSRFVWNFLADRTSTPRKNIESSCTEKCNNDGEVCIRKGSESKGRCVVSTTRYIPAYSTRLSFNDGTWRILPANSSDPLGSVDPIWTESYWDPIQLQVYTVQPSGIDHLVLIGGFGITVVSYVLAIFTRTFFMKVMKDD